MLDISGKITTQRTATASASIQLREITITRIREGTVPKGHPLEVAKVAAVQAAKNTSQIIPYCHPLPVDAVDIVFEIGETKIDLQVTVKAIYKTGVEMEALTAATVAALTIYDMTKGIDDSLTITGVRLISKRGGRSDFADTYSTPLRAAVLVASDSISAGKKSDFSGKAIVERLKTHQIEVVEYKVVSDEPEIIERELINFADTQQLNLVITTGGTGFGPRDNMPEVMARVIEREVPGIPEATRSFGQDRTPFSMLSRGRAGLRGRTLIINLPGSRKGVAESLDALFPGLLHAFKMLAGGGHPTDERKT